ncbi:hypothetical protein H8B02_16725 [Bradyrhizobium sp. Pear77]|uniref:hypothetical protein n=1 Tax=Bradyrhizobium altum TaxID=1571202 RepID=UPI001E5415DE|nr:hypothetical protein [Bradyrhizobium altum]MCC8955024.1 hypothetical protein [Bradyrhizobium altum]
MTASPNCLAAKFGSSNALIIFPTTRKPFGFKGGKVLSDRTAIVEQNEAIRLIDKQIELHGEAIGKHLAQYDARSALPTWHGTIRDIEEFINVILCGDIDDEKSLRLMRLPVGAGLAANPNVALLARDLVAPYYGEAVAKRFMITMLRVTRTMVGFLSDGRSLGDSSQVYSVADAAGYFQSRRRHFVSLLYMMPEVCSGTRPLAPEMAFNELLPLVEHCCISFTSWSWKGVLAEVFKDFTLVADKRGAYPSHEYDALEGVFLEPERVSLVDIHQQRGGDLTPTRAEPQDPAKIFSAPELRNNVRFIQAAYDAFGLNDHEYSALSLLVTAFSRYCEDDYFIRIEVGKFRSMLAAQTVFPSLELEGMLLGGDADFKQASNSFIPFLPFGEFVESNVNLLTRFLNAFKNVHLGSRKRFQIHAGFIFEQKVAADLSELGFAVTGIKRINRAEFDVVTVRGDTIYNFQCKNNWIDLSKLETDRRLLARYNRSLDRYYRSALAKEKNREGLLLSELRLAKIEHYVISRFPVITENLRVISYNRLVRKVSQM